MSWNKPASDMCQTRRANSKNAPKGLLVAIILFLIGISVSVWVFSYANIDDRKGISKPRSQHMPCPDIVKGGESKSSLKKHDSSWSPRKEPHKTKNIKPPSRSTEDVIKFREKFQHAFGKELFDSPSDNFIAGVISAVPGDRFIDVVLGKEFDDDFNKALRNKIEFKESDTEVEKDIKQAVIETKLELLKCLDNGESPADIIRKARDELNEIADYRDKLQENLSLLIHGGSEKDVEEYLKESNEMLAEYGARPLHISPFTYKQMRKRLEQEAATSEKRIPSL